MEFLHEKIALKIADRGAAIAIGSQMSFQIEIGIGIAIAISISEQDRDRDLNFGDRGHALQATCYFQCYFAILMVFAQ